MCTHSICQDDFQATFPASLPAYFTGLCWSCWLVHTLGTHTHVRSEYLGSTLPAVVSAAIMQWWCWCEQAVPSILCTVYSRVRHKCDADLDLAFLQATAVIERIRRAISETSDAVNTRLQPISSAFGKAFKVDDWAVELFAEEVVRGGPAFAVSLILSAMEPGFRAAAELGAWQLISPVNVTGKVLVVANLYEVQDKVRPCCLLAWHAQLVQDWPS